MDSLVLIANLNSLKSLVKNLCYPNYLIYAPERISSFQQIDKNIKIMSILQMPPTSGRRSLTQMADSCSMRRLESRKILKSKIKCTS